MQETILKQEQAVLMQKLKQVHQELENTKLMRENLPGLYRLQPELLAEMSVQAHHHLQHMEQMLQKPYFARIDFHAKDTAATDVCYLGKHGIMDESQQNVTVDWRAPIAALYYDSDLGRAAYEAPEGERTGELLLKRQYDIESGTLKSYNDVDTVSNDELLMPYLAAGGDHRLKNIVATIQGEQNQIIRKKINQNLIVQGVAGSGKTTVALHRIAYLVYNHRDEIKSRQYMVIGPNRFFISYIASVLPDLDVNSVPDHTFETLCGDYLGEAFTVENVSQRLHEIVHGGDGSIDRYKTGMAYKEAIDRFFEEFLKEVIPQKDFTFRDFTILTRAEIERVYETVDLRLNTTLQAQVNQCILYLSCQIENKLPLHRQRLDQYLREQAQKDIDGTGLEKRRRDRATILKELESGCQQTLKKYFAITSTRILKLYGQFLNHCEQWMQTCPADVKVLKNSTLDQLKRKEVSFADLPALIYLKLRMKGSEGYNAFRHAVIDEAQDFGAFHFYALRCLLSGSTFTIVGDLAQSIFNYRSINSWESVKELAFDGNAEITLMCKSYRTTVEIMQTANRVIERLGLPAAEPVIRHGEPTRFIHYEPETRIETITECIRAHETAGSKTIALICKTVEAAGELNEMLRQNDVEAVQITPESAGFRQGICTIPSYLSKGLEFDAVILCDASATVYHVENRTDMHLLYVAMTRALHRLDILYSGVPAAPLTEDVAKTL